MLHHGMNVPFFKSSPHFVIPCGIWWYPLIIMGKQEEKNQSKYCNTLAISTHVRQIIN
jgi:hypothetical protein